MATASSLPAAIVMAALIVYPFAGPMVQLERWLHRGVPPLAGSGEFSVDLRGPHLPADIASTIIFAVTSVVLKSVFGLGLAFASCNGKQVETLLAWLGAHSLRGAHGSHHLRLVADFLIRPIVTSTGR